MRASAAPASRSDRAGWRAVRNLLAHLGTLLVLVGLGGLLYLALAPDEAEPPVGQPSGETRTGEAGVPERLASASDVGGGAAEPAQPGDSARQGLTGGQGDGADRAPATGPITRIDIPAIGLAAEVVPARLTPLEGTVTWTVPAFRAGHAERSAGAGEPGRAILLGHVTSRAAGNVFRDLGRARPGDVVRVFSGPEEFSYAVDAVRSVPRTDTSVLRPTETPSLVLITCSGVWLPILWDYTERLVVEGGLVPPGRP